MNLNFEKAHKSTVGPSELLVVIVILGIIAAIVIPMVMTNQDNASVTSDERSVQLLQDAVNRYMVENENNVPRTSTGQPDYDELVPDYLSGEINLRSGASVNIAEGTVEVTYTEPTS